MIAVKGVICSIVCMHIFEHRFLYIKYLFILEGKELFHKRMQRSGNSPKTVYIQNVVCTLRMK